MSEQNIRHMQWRVNTPSLMKEILNNDEMHIMTQPLRIFSSILHEVATRASELNDPQLNALMCRLSLYSVCDPYDKEYSSETAEEIIKRCEK